MIPGWLALATIRQLFIPKLDLNDYLVFQQRGLEPPLHFRCNVFRLLIMYVIEDTHQ